MPPEKLDEVKEEEVSLRDTIIAAAEEASEAPADETIDEDINTGADDNDDDGIEPEPDGDEDKPEGDDKPIKGDEKPAADKVAKDTPADDGKKAKKVKDVAPVDLSPTMREKWKDLDPDAKAYIVERENKVKVMMQEGAQNRKLGQDFTSISEPYRALMAQEGARNPLEAVQALFETVGTLRLGSPEQKAAKIGQLIKAYGVDVVALDDHLLAQNPDPNAKPAIDPAVQAHIDAQLAPVNTLVQQQTQQQQQFQEQQQGQVTSAIDTFANAANEDGSIKHEFFNDVRLTMANFLDVAAQNGQQMSLEQAYTQACHLTPEVKTVLDQRNAQATLTGKNNNAAKKKAASVSIMGVTGETPAPSGDGSLRDDILASIDAAS